MTPKFTHFSVFGRQSAHAGLKKLNKLSTEKTAQKLLGA
jgi:hypothetical protein